MISVFTVDLPAGSAVRNHSEDIWWMQWGVFRGNASDDSCLPALHVFLISFGAIRVAVGFRRIGQDGAVFRGYVANMIVGGS